ncbi:MAG: Lar family restriction alleviation protein [Atopobiaceae bacterium]|nr:Lar family restriction alleviation protein [Atopobiaceae bacterium]
MDGELTYQAWATNYENELPKLLPCPFCGGEADVFEHYTDHYTYAGCAGRVYWGIRCANKSVCMMSPYTQLFVSKSEAIEAWNSRAETVTVTTGITTVTDTPQITYVPERTCKRITLGLEREREIATVSWICSACGKHMSRDDNYCPNCGARVTPKNSETTPKVVSE